MTTTEHADGLFEQPDGDLTYPGWDYQMSNGRRVWSLGEEGEFLMVEGHGALARAALVEYLIRKLGYGHVEADLTVERASAAGDVPEVHAVFPDECGCTPAEHRKHVKLGRVRGLEHCEVVTDVCEDRKRCKRPALPPCNPLSDAAWLVEYVPPTEPGALSILMVCSDIL